MPWNLRGNYVETCSCELMCPCNLSFDHGATYDFCRVTLVFDILEGQVDGTDIGGLRVAAIADTPKVMTDGNWRLGMFVDERATDEQADKLVQVFSGQLGGPMGALAPLVGEMLGVERVRIDVEDDGLRHSVRIGDAIDFEIEDIVPFGVDTGRPVRFDGMFHPVAPDLTMAEARGRESVPSASSTRARPGCRSPTSRGPPDAVIASSQGRVGSGAGLGPAFAAVRARLALVVLLFALAIVGWWLTIGQMLGDGRRAVDGARDARLVPRRLGRDDGRDDVPVGGSDGRALLADDTDAFAAEAAPVRRAATS